MSDLVEIAVLAFRNARYVEAADVLEQALVQKPDNWVARLYLAMAYRKLDRLADTWRNLEKIAAECPESEIVERAEQMLLQLKSEFQQSFGKSGDHASDNDEKRDEAVGEN
jgi:hypothetical protein